MRRLSVVMLTASLFLLTAPQAQAQPKPLKEQVVGVWSLVSGSQIGANAVGLLILDASGLMSMQIMHPDRMKFASNSRTHGTADENKSAVQGMISYFGRYSVSEADSVMSYQIDRSSFPNWDGTVQKRPFTVTAEELRYTNPAPSSGGAPAQLLWKRAK